MPSSPIDHRPRRPGTSAGDEHDIGVFSPYSSICPPYDEALGRPISSNLVLTSPSPHMLARFHVAPYRGCSPDAARQQPAARLVHEQVQIGVDVADGGISPIQPERRY
jgi:hypothetical protein